MESYVPGDTKIFAVENTTLIASQENNIIVVASQNLVEVEHLQPMSTFKEPSQGLHKRSRMLSASLFDFRDIKQAETSLPAKPTDFDVMPPASQFLAEINGKEVLISSGKTLIRGTGLFRSKSFPPEGWQQTGKKCVLKISRTSRSSTATGVQEHVFTIVSNNHNGSPKEAHPGFGAKWTAESKGSCSQTTPLAVHEIGKQQRQVEQKFLEKACCSSENVVASSSMQVLVEHVEKKPLAVSERQVVALQSAVCVDSSTVAGGLVETSGESPAEKVLDLEVPVALGKDIGRGSPLSSKDNVLLKDQMCPPCGKLLVCGRRREMEDTAAIVPSFASLRCGVAGGGCQKTTKNSDLHFFGVYDGHGGSQASMYCTQRLHQLLADEISTHVCTGDCQGVHTDPSCSKWDDLMRACFLKMDIEVGGVCPNGVCDDDATDSTCTCCGDAIAPGNVGTTAVVAVIGSSEIVVANCGDSRAVLSRGGIAIPLSRDHKPERDDETSRIEAAGGRVICWDGYRVGGLLALSRAIGDRYMKRYIISDPEVTCTQRTGEDEFLILASDGLWDVMNNDYACDVARRSLAAARKKHDSVISPSPGEDPASASVAALLVKLAYSKGSKDNISVIVVDLKARC